MPTISKFYGIRITMNPFGREHNPPHIHVEYGSTEGIVDIKNSEQIDGNLSNRTLRYVDEWLNNNRKELLGMWKTQIFSKLPPLE